MLVLTYFSTLWISLSSLQLCLASFSLFLLLCGIKIVIVSMVHNGEFYRHTCFSYSPWVNQCTNTDGRSDIHSGSGHMFFLCSEWLYSNSTHMNFNYLLQLYTISHHLILRLDWDVDVYSLRSSGWMSMLHMMRRHDNLLHLMWRSQLLPARLSVIVKGSPRGSIASVGILTYI